MKMQTAKRITEAAAQLFLRYSYGGVSVDAIAEKAGCTKVTVYEHFQSKEALLIAALSWRLKHREMQLDAEANVQAPGTRGVTALFDWMAAQKNGEDFSGCAFLKAAQEVGNAVEPIRQVTLESKRMIQQRIRHLLMSAGRKNATRLAGMVALLLEGAQSISFVERDVRAFGTARAAAVMLMESDRAMAPSKRKKKSV